nr:MAG TPA: Coagulation factor VIII fold protein [Caudoviricetes sp.]
MSWELLPTDYTDRTWNGQQRFNEIDNGDGTVSFLDVTVYTNKEKSFFGAKDANRMNEALNTLMGMVENGTDLYESFQNYFETQKKSFETKSDQELTDFTEYQHRIFTTWFNSIKDQLSTDQAGHLQNQLNALKEKHDKDIDSVTKKLITLTVTTDDELIGDTVKVTKDSTTLEQTFDASKSLTFHLPELGTWTVTSTNPDHSGSSEVTCEMYGRYAVTLAGGFNWKKWVTAGGLSVDGYASLTDVLADEKVVRQLMTKHASADILADATIKNLAGLRAKITASKTAMKWIGLRDYICDKLLADAGTQADLLASDHWRYILKDGVPCMTSATSPYGEVETTASTMAPYYAYKVFSAPPNQDRDSWAAPVGEQRIGYRFTTPICIKRVALTNRVQGGTANRCVKDFVLVASNDGKTWDELGRFTGKNYEGTEAHTDHFDLKNDKYYLHYALRILSSHDATYVGIGRLNFYGRSLNISVPAMTSDTAPWGKIIYSSQWDGGSSAGRQAFSGADSPWYPSPSDSSGKAYIGYVYPTPTRVRQVTFICHNGNQNEVCVVERSDDGEHWEKASDEIQITVDNETKILNVNASPARYWRIRNVSGNIYVANQGGFNLRKVQIYGVDYSERDDRTYIYDHGMELTPLNVKITDGTIPLNPPEKKETYIQLTAPSGKSCGVGVAIDVTNLKRLRAVTDQGTINVGAEFGRFFATTEGNTQAYIAYASASAPPYNHSLDLTSITGVKTLVHLVWSGLSTGLSEMWLE